MARFISKHQRYSLGIRDEVGMVTAQGVPIVAQAGILANFSHGGLAQWEVDEALEVFEFHGLPEGINPVLRLSCYDTDFAEKEERWPEGVKDEVENVLRTSGRLGSDYIEVGRPRVPSPWPTYDEASFARILNRVIEDGYDPAEVLEYERQSQKREDVIKALEGMVIDAGPAADTEPELIQL